MQFLIGLVLFLVEKGQKVSYFDFGTDIAKSVFKKGLLAGGE